MPAWAHPPLFEDAPENRGKIEVVARRIAGYDIATDHASEERLTMCNSGRKVCQFGPSLVLVLVCCQPSFSATPPDDAATANADQLKELAVELSKANEMT
jgi:hypothetical protein